MRISKETFKLTDDMKSGYIMPISGLGSLEHSGKIGEYTTPDYLSEKSLNILEDSGINIVNCENVTDEAKQLLAYHKIGVCNVQTNIRAMIIGESAADYEKYLNDFCESEKPKYLSYINQLYTNIYENKVPLEAARRNFIENANIVNRYAQKLNIPFWGNVQAGGNLGKEMHSDVNLYYPGDSEFLWMVNVLLATGAKGIQYYPLVQEFEGAICPDGAIDPDRNGILGADGLPTIFWSYARTANEHIRAVGPMLMQSDSMGLVTTGNATEFTNGAEGVFADGRFRQLKSVEYDDTGVIIGCLDFKHRTGFYVVNNDLVRRRDVTLNFDGEQTVVISQLGNQKTEVKKESVTIGLTAGGGALIYLWKHLGD